MPAPLADALDMTGQVVLITGGTKGVGRGITDRFLEAGADVVVTARNEPDAPIEVGGRRAAFLAADVRDVEQVDAVVAFAVERFGRLDLLVNNAGGSPPGPAATASPRFSASIIALNLTAPLNLAQRANAVMQEQPEGGSIINIGSVNGMRPSPGSANGRRYSRISSSVRSRRTAAGSRCSTNMLSSSIQRSPSSVRIRWNVSTPRGQSSHASGRTMASM